MPMRQLEANVRDQAGIAILDLHGEINAFAENELNRAYATASERHPPTILLNFADVDYINSTGIALIVRLMAESRKTGINLIASGLSEHYQEIFNITRLADFMSIFPNEESALESEKREA